MFCSNELSLLERKSRRAQATLGSNVLQKQTSCSVQALGAEYEYTPIRPELLGDLDLCYAGQDHLSISRSRNCCCISDQAITVTFNSSTAYLRFIPDFFCKPFVFVPWRAIWQKSLQVNSRSIQSRSMV